MVRMKSLRAQVVLITGAGGDLGQTMTRRFLWAGSHVILADLSTDGLRQTAEAGALDHGTRPMLGTVLGCAGADLSTRAGCDHLYEQCRGISSHIDILVNNAGVSVGGDFMDIPEEDWERVLLIDLIAPMRLTSRFLPDMISRKSGHIVNVSSTAGLVGFWHLAPYCAAKSGLRGFGEALYADVWRYGIDVTTIYPFLTGSMMLTGASAHQVPKSLIYDVDFVVSELLKGIQRRRRHVYPGAIPKLIDGVRRVAPWVFPLNRFRWFEWLMSRRT